MSKKKRKHFACMLLNVKDDPSKRQTRRAVVTVERPFFGLSNNFGFIGIVQYSNL